MKQHKKKVSIKKIINNKGLTLVELLVTITILAIVVVPLLNTFVASERLNNKAQNRMKATVIAENLMEEFEDISVEQLANSVGATPDADGKYVFYYNSADLSEWGSNLFNAIVTLDPSGAYSALNDTVVSDVNAITATGSAVYSMHSTFDQSVYNIFAARSSSAHQEDPTTYIEKNVAFFEENLDRSISFRITKGGVATDPKGKNVQLVKVSIVIKYQYNLSSSIKALRSSDITYSVSKDLFDNSKSITPLESIYLIYTPRYKACQNGRLDSIEVNNAGNVATDLYVISQASIDPSVDAAYLPSYLSGKKASITIVEEPAWVGAYTTTTPASLQLRTNLIKTDTITGISTAACKLTYRNSLNTQSANTATSSVILKMRTADGKAADGNAAKDRIYKMTVEVFKNGESTPMSTTTGTKIN